jgi:hypothetical protein
VVDGGIGAGRDVFSALKLSETIVELSVVTLTDRLGKYSAVKLESGLLDNTRRTRPPMATVGGNKRGKRRALKPRIPLPPLAVPEPVSGRIW